MAYDSDRVENKAFAKGQIQPSTVPNSKVSDTEFAFLIQRAPVPADFKGIVTAQWVEGSEALKGYLANLTGTEADPVALAALKTAQTELTDAITLKATSTETKAALTALEAEIADLDLTKADKTAVEAANKTIADLTLLLADNTATDAAIQTAVDAVEAAIANAQPQDLSSKADKAALDELAVRVNALSVSGDVKGIVGIDGDRYIIKNNLIYGVRRATRNDVTSINSNLASGEYSALNGQGTITGFYNATSQWVSYFFDQTHTFVWDVTCDYEILSAATTGKNFLDINGKDYALSYSAGRYTYKWAAPAIGTRLSKVQYAEASSRSYLHDLKVRISDDVTPAYTDANGRINSLAIGDTFRLAGQGLNVICRYDGIDPASGAWRATPTQLLSTFDTQLTIGSRNGVENNAIALRFAEIVGSVPEAGNTLEKIWNYVQTAGQDWILLNTLAERDALTADSGGKYIRVTQARIAADNSDVWAVYYARPVFNDDPAIAPTLQFILLFDQESGGSADLALEVAALEAANTDLRARVAALEVKPSSPPEILQIERPIQDDDFAGDWKQCQQTIKDLSAWTLAGTLWIRVGKDSAYPINSYGPVALEVGHADAVETNGTFTVRLSPDTEFRYQTVKGDQRIQANLDFLSFPAGVYSDISWRLLKADKTELGYGTANGGGVVNGFMTGWSQAYNTPFPSDAKWVRIVLSKVAGGQIIFEYPV